MTATQPHPPAYAAGDSKTSVVDEKERDSQYHSQSKESQTPYIDAQLARPPARNALLALSSAFAAAAEEDRNLKDVVQSVVPEVSSWMEDVKKQKKNGEISKEDKKELKKEMKWLFKDVKKEVKASWKTKS